MALPPTYTDRTLAQALDLALERTARLVALGHRSPATLAIQREHVRYLLERLEPHLPLDHLTTGLLEAFCDAEVQGRRGRPLRGTSLPKRLATLRLALRCARRRGWIAELPAWPEVIAPYVPDTRHLRSYAEYRRLFLALPRRRAEWMAFAVFTGQHASDIHRATRADLDLEASPPLIRIRNSKNRKPKGVWVPIPEELIRLFSKRWARLPPDGKLVTPWVWRGKELRSACARAGISPTLCATSFRHTCATWLIRRVGITKAVMEWLGHSSFAMISRVYGHALPGEMREASAALEDMARAERRPPRRAPRRGQKRGRRRADR
ncbi:MAG: tyrosine-type recombinase/integrase [Solirubrobacterales bacterium]|nr:tyrosine-type recombinase/integrase [Solirubrobacterales bacterium]